MSDIGLSIIEINKRINETYSLDVENSLSDLNLKYMYIKSSSTQKKIKILQDILVNENIESEKIKNVIDNYVEHLVSPGAKGVIRGNIFNNLVKEFIINLNLPKDRFDIQFEKNNPLQTTNEIPDWYINCKLTHKNIVGMNQIDLWSGGQQSNRGSKYVIDYDKGKLVSVIAKYVNLKNKKNKVYHLFNTGFQRNNLCYLEGLKNIIFEHFEL